MKRYTVTFQPGGKKIPAEEGITLFQAQTQAGICPDAPCGGRGTCGKCKVVLDGQEALACRIVVGRDMTVALSRKAKMSVLTQGFRAKIPPDGISPYVLAFDVGTTTVAGYLLNGTTGMLMASAGCLNPQVSYGADVISRIQCALDGGADELQSCILDVLRQLICRMIREADITPDQVMVTAIAGNTVMCHFLLRRDTKPLITPAYMSDDCRAVELAAADFLPVGGTLRILSNIVGFVGGDTVECMTAVHFDRLEELTLLIDIGTNGGLVLGDRNRRVACSTAAGPAFEGAKLSCGMRGQAGAIDHVALEDGSIRYHVIGGGRTAGLCGSGLWGTSPVKEQRRVL